MATTVVGEPIRRVLLVDPDAAFGNVLQEVLDDDYVKAKDVKRLLLCTGKIYYDLLEEQQNNKRKDVLA